MELHDNLMSDVRRLVFALRLHRPNSQDGESKIQTEICRRLYWEAIAIDQFACT